MYIQDEIIEAVKALAEKYDIPKVDMVAEMNHAAWMLLECGKIDQWPVTPNVQIEAPSRPLAKVASNAGLGLDGPEGKKP